MESISVLEQFYCLCGESCLKKIIFHFKTPFENSDIKTRLGFPEVQCTVSCYCCLRKYT